jgi:hypothetical protein
LYLKDDINCTPGHGSWLCCCNQGGHDGLACSTSQKLLVFNEMVTAGMVTAGPFLVVTDWLRLVMICLLYFKVISTLIWAMGPGCDAIMNMLVT